MPPYRLPKSPRWDRHYVGSLPFPSTFRSNQALRVAKIPAIGRQFRFSYRTRQAWEVFGEAGKAKASPGEETPDRHLSK